MGAPDLGVHGPKSLSREAGRARRTLAEELFIVLSLSLLPSAVNALLTLFEAPIAGIRVSLFSNVGLIRQVIGIVFSLAPVALVFHLVQRSGEGVSSVGLQTASLRRDLAAGALLGTIVSGVGLILYLASVALEINRFVVPVPPLGHWWTIPVLLLGAAAAALLEEVIVAGYMISRLLDLGWSGSISVGTSALLRGAYHLYQGWGGFVGNLALGAFFGWIFLRWRRTWPLIVAHFLVDTLAGLAYIAVHGRCFFGACIP